MKLIKKQESYTKKDKDGKAKIVGYTAFYLDFENGISPKKIQPVFKSDYDVLKLMATERFGKEENE